MNSEPVKFLLVDDIEENLTALEGLLRRDGLELLKARSGAEALELLLVHEVSLAILDVQMPEMDGFELAELMRGAEITKHVPIIFVTAGGRDPQRMFKGYETGAVDFLFKPIEPHVLKSKADVFFELSRQRKELSNVLRLNEMFVGILGHDLRNPLGAVLTGAQLLETQLEDATQLRIVRRMLSAGERMKAMVEQLLDLTRARLAGGLGFVRTRRLLDIGALAKRAVEELQPSHPERALKLEVRGDATTAGDPDRLLQLLSNLISNALHHGQHDAPVWVEVDGEERHVHLRVRNHGSIPPERIPTLFDPFRTGQGHGGGSKGLGLGLFISQQIALAHGGTIAVTSNFGQTEVSVSIPRMSPASVRFPQAHARRVLIVEDEEQVRESLREAFQAEGYDASTASNGREALELLAQPATRPDLVVLDLVMPVVDGGSVYRAMQSDPALSQIPVVVSTSSPARAPAGALVVPKPVNLERLLVTVRRFLTEEPSSERSGETGALSNQNQARKI